MTISHEKAARLLTDHDQPHVLTFWNSLDATQRAGLLSQVESLDFTSIALMKNLLGRVSSESPASGLKPAHVLTLSDPQRAEARSAGELALAAGSVGVILVAGGQGSRLGFEGPKGSFPIAPLSQATLFEIHSKKILALERRYRTCVPFYIMTSEENNRATVEFFEQHRYFGLSRDRVLFFIQGKWPALDSAGKIILDRPDHIFMSPDGHGGILSALKNRGVLRDMAERKLTCLFYFQVDNPLVEIADPPFIGLHILRKADMSVKVCAKRDPQEGLGVVVERNGRTAVVEYTELTDAQKNERLPDGQLKFSAGSVAIHIFSLAFLAKEADASLPIHVAFKKVPHCDDTGTTITPDKPNAYKFEKFIFDALPDAQNTVVLEFRREDEFSPVKNAAGKDSPETTRQDMVSKFARWLGECGVAVPVGAGGRPAHLIEIDPCFAADPGTLKGKLSAGFKVTGDVLLR